MPTPITEPIDLDAAKSYMRIDPDDNTQDNDIVSMISACRSAMERELGVYVVARQVTENFRPKTCCGFISPEYWKPKYGPVADPVFTDTKGETKDIQPVNGDSEWPLYKLSVGYDLTYTAGYEECPEDLKLALKMRVATAFENRENSTDESVNRVLNSHNIYERSYNRNVF